MDRNRSNVYELTLEPPNGSFVTHGGVSLIIAPVRFQGILRFSLTFPNFITVYPGEIFFFKLCYFSRYDWTYLEAPMGQN